MDILKVISDELNIKLSQVEATVKLIDEGNTIPFIARYRKEVTGSLNDEVLRNLDERLKYLRNLEDRKATVIASIEEQGKLTEELKKQIEEAATLVLVEDLYRPYKQKKRTRAIIAKEKGLEPLANIITLQMTTKPIEEEAAEYIETLLAKEQSICGLYRSLLSCDRIYCELVGKKNTSEAIYLHNKEYQKFVKSMKNFPSVIRTEYVYALLAEKDEEKAAEWMNRFEKVAKTHPSPNDIDGERELVERAIE